MPRRHHATARSRGVARGLVALVLCATTAPREVFAAPRGYAGPMAVAADPDAPTIASHDDPVHAAKPAREGPPPAPDVDPFAAEDLASEDSIEDDEAIGEAPLDWRDEPEGEVAWRRIRGGAILLAGGGLLVAGAAILGSVDPCRRLAGNGCQEAARTRAVVTMAVPGTAILLGGAALLAVGLRQRNRVRASLSAPLAGNGAWGLVVGGRF
jgi:hypothetical protein